MKSNNTTQRLSSSRRFNCIISQRLQKGTSGIIYPSLQFPTALPPWLRRRRECTPHSQRFRGFQPRAGATTVKFGESGAFCSLLLWEQSAANDNLLFMCSEKQGPGAKLLLGVEWPRFREYVNANAMTTFNGDTIDCSDNENIVSKRTGSCLVIMRGTHSTLHKLRMLMSQLSTNL